MIWDVSRAQALILFFRLPPLAGDLGGLLRALSRRIGADRAHPRPFGRLDRGDGAI